VLHVRCPSRLTVMKREMNFDHHTSSDYMDQDIPAGQFLTPLSGPMVCQIFKNAQFRIAQSGPMV
jgi:hypothetical protein